MRRVVFATFVVALVGVVSAAPAVARTHAKGPHPLACFRAHGWVVLGSRSVGTAHPEPLTSKAFWKDYVSWVHFPSPARAGRWLFGTYGVLTAVEIHAFKNCSRR
jgi:hypothetical protein